ncbi:MAG: tetratricopeptide repeat protein [Chloroflexi bacterium]|nr:tetratricopeptide repeat protein [Chloroflexota bacterium]
MAVFHLQLLGAFQAKVDEAPVTAFRSDKIRALLAYLALNGGRPYSRETLATLLWGEYSQAAARASLRQALSNLRQAAAPLLSTQPPALIISQQSVQLNTDHTAVWVDVVTLRRLLAAVDHHDHADARGCLECRHWLATAVSLYHGDFLPGLQLDDSPDFADWRLLQQESLHQQMVHALHSLSASYAAANDLPRQADTLRRLLHLLPWQENAHRDLMAVLAHSGQRAAALAQYERCRQVLADELGVEPSAETNTLYRLIQTDTLPVTPPSSALRHDALRHNLPPPTTPLIGRDELLAQVVAILSGSAARLITLMGPGGVGKTRLALAAAQQVMPDFADGVWFASLADVPMPDPASAQSILAAAVSDHLRLVLQQPDAPWDSLAAYLAHKTALLVLDNLEHLLPAAAQFVAALLEAAPQITILATSQARLRVRAERVVPVGGLALPEADQMTLATVAQNGSIALFAERAGQTLTGFSLNATNLAAVADICRLVDGLPLAIELTAALTEHFTAEEIAAALRHNIALLAESPGAADLPARQQGITAVFAYAWRLLTPVEQEVLAQISLFRGEFSRDAALEVGGRSVAALAALVDKSLLRVTRPGRYALHALVRHFAADALADRPDLQAGALARYGRYYANFLQQMQPALQGPQQRAAIAAIRVELDNVRHAWETAVADAHVDQLAVMLPPLAAFFADSGKLTEGKTVFTAAAERLRPLRQKDTASAGLVARLDTWRAYFMGETGRLETAVSLLRAVLPELEQIDDAVGVGHCLRVLGSYETQLDQSAGGIAHLQQARQCFSELGDQAALATTLSALGRAWENQGDYALAQESFAQSLVLLRQRGAPQSLAKGLSNYGLLLHRLGDNDGAAAALREAVLLDEAGGNLPAYGASLANLGLVLAARGEYADAQAAYLQALTIQQNEGNQARVAILLNNLGDVANAQGQPEQALVYLQESLALKQAASNERGMIFSLVHLGHTYWRLEQTAEAAAAYGQALALAQKLGVKPLLLAALVGLAEVAMTRGETALAQQMLWLAAAHPASWQRVRDEAAAVAAQRHIMLEPIPAPLPDLTAVTRQALNLVG